MQGIESFCLRYDHILKSVINGNQSEESERAVQAAVAEEEEEAKGWQLTQHDAATVSTAQLLAKAMAGDDPDLLMQLYEMAAAMEAMYEVTAGITGGDNCSYSIRFD